jgi:serine protease Do
MSHWQNHKFETGAVAAIRRFTVAGSLFGVSLISLSLLPAAPALAQLKSDAPSIQTPMGRAPLTFADIVDRVKPAVVSVYVTNGRPKVASRSGRPPRGDLFPDLPDDHPLNEFFKNLPREFRGAPMPSPRPTLAQGSGFVISPDGYIVTNNHVIDGASKVQVTFDEQNKYEAEVVGA